MRIDLHMHSSASDGTDSPSQLMSNAHAAGLAAVALTDHDAFDGLEEGREAAAELGVVFVPGMEMSTKVSGRTVHLLMYGGDPTDTALLAELSEVHLAREARVPNILGKLASIGMPVEESLVREFAGETSSIGRPHIAAALVSRGFVAHVEDAFHGLLDEQGSAYVPRYSTDLEEAIPLIHGARGVAVLAHPWTRGRHEELVEDYLKHLVNDLGLDGLEVDNPAHTPEQRAQLGSIATRLGILITGGSDHHGTAKKANYSLGAGVTSPDQFKRLQSMMIERGGLI